MITFVIGTHAELIKTFPIMIELQRLGIDYNFISTGQHELTRSAIDFGVKIPIVLDKKNGFKGHTGNAIIWAFTSIFPLKKKLKEVNATIVLCHGDTMSTMCAVIAAKLNKIPCMHIEGGLRSYNIKEPFPEEIIRRIVDKLCDIAFVPSMDCAKNLKKNKSVVTGNTVYDSLQSLYKPDRCVVSTKKYAIATIHRHENIKSKERMTNIVNILSQCPIEVKVFLHGNTKEKLQEYGLLQTLSQHTRIQNTIDYRHFLQVMSKSSLVYTDGGSMSEECVFFNIPCIILRMTTERKELLLRSDQFLTELNVDNTKIKVNEFLENKFKNMFNPYYHNISPAKAIVSILLSVIE